MSLWYVAWSYLWSRKFTTFLTILSVALAVGLISALLTIRNETRARFEEEQQAYDIVVGPPGSPLQLVLNAVYNANVTLAIYGHLYSLFTGVPVALAAFVWFDLLLGTNLLPD